LKDWVDDGGRLVLLGGPTTFGLGGMSWSYQGEEMPFAPSGASELVQLEAPVVLGPGPSTSYPGDPALLWWHEMTLRSDATVDAYAGGQPVAARRASGLGQVVAFVGTVMGEPAPGVTPFWETNAWVELLQQLVLGTPSASADACCETGDGPGCVDPLVEACVCAVDPYCCTTEWDWICAGEVTSLGCHVCPPPPPPSNECCEVSGTAGCTDAIVEACVCGSDPYCCDVAWDQLFVDEVESLAGGTCE
jgi:hypothetical protein